MIIDLVGHLNTIIPIWSSEVTDANVRGAFLAFEFFLGIIIIIITTAIPSFYLFF